MPMVKHRKRDYKILLISKYLLLSMPWNVSLSLQHVVKFYLTYFRLSSPVPKAKRIVYSTCSIHPDENEHVVKKILKNNPQFDLATRESVLPTWQRRGIPAEINGNAGKK